MFLKDNEVSPATCNLGCSGGSPQPSKYLLHVDILSYISYTVNMEEIFVILYTSDTGKQPFADWQRKLEAKTKSIVIARIARIRQGIFGDCKKIKGAEIWELRVDFGPGYRLYFGKDGTTIVVLLVGGDKRSQMRDIKKAQEYWLDYKEQKDD